MSLLHIEKIRESVRHHLPERRAITSSIRRAAVAIVLRPKKKDTEALFILRSIKEGDPWSGHMAFPGGHQDDSDSSLKAAAERETMEEVGLDLDRGWIGFRFGSEFGFKIYFFNFQLLGVGSAFLFSHFSLLLVYLGF